MLQRQDYLRKLIAFKDKNLIKVIMGIRRCGKSTLLKIYADYLLSRGIKPEQIISINFEDMNNADLLAPKALHSYLLRKIIKKKKNYIFLDEIQMVPDFEIVVNSLNLRKNIDIYITGSNAYFLSGELATLLAGRYIALKMLPLSFAEYYAAADGQPGSGKSGYPQLQDAYEKYIRFSSFPYVLELEQDIEKVNAYLAAIVDAIVLKDVVARKKITNIAALERLIKFIFSNIGSITSTKKISDTMRSAGFNISIQTVETYLAALQDSYIIYKVGRADVSGKEYLKANDKYYVADLGLRRYLLGDKYKDYGAVLENIIYLELLRRGYNVFVGRAGNLEIDFIAEKAGVKEYYQVAYTVQDSKTWEREALPLTKIKDNYQKFVVTFDNAGPKNDNGIQTINVFDFLLSPAAKTSDGVIKQVYF
jgi:predicted AAA+ superfamily ATPase